MKHYEAVCKETLTVSLHQEHNRCYKPQDNHPVMILVHVRSCNNVETN